MLSFIPLPAAKRPMLGHNKKIMSWLSDLSSVANRIHSQSLAIRPALQRVVQLDGELLESEFSRILVTQVDNCVDALTVSDQPLSPLRAAQSWRDEFWLALSAVLYKWTMWDRGQLAGDRLLNIIYRDEAATSNVNLASTLQLSSENMLPNSKKLVHAALFVILPYLFRKLQRRSSERQWEFSEPGSLQRRMSTVLDWSEKIFKVLVAVNFVLFLWKGDYRSPLDRLLRFRLVQDSQRMNRVVNMEYLNQQLLWTAIFGFLNFLLPLMNMGRLWSTVSSRVRRESHAPTDDRLVSCSQCGIQPVTQPRLSTPCRHVYCYYCIAQRTIGADFRCARCAGTITGFVLPTVRSL